MSPKKRVAVIGAGLAGIEAIKALKEEGMEPVCFERLSQLGGLWRYHEDTVHGQASVMKTTISNTSKEIGAISICPPPEEYPNFMHNTLVLKYIELLAEKGDCVRHIQFNHETVKVEKVEDYEDTGRWKVTCRNTKTGDLVTDPFDGVCVCIGHHVFPNEPEFPRQSEFQGKIMHTHSLKNADGFSDLRVVVVGTGNSGLDAAVDISSVAKQVYLSTRRGTWVWPRLGPNGIPFDVVLSKRFMYLLQNMIPHNLACSLMERMINNRFDHGLYNLKPKHRILEEHSAVSDTIPIKLLCGTVVVRRTIKHFTKNGVVFEGEDKETEVDVVVFATGYKIRFPFLENDVVPVVNNQVQLYKFIYPPHLPHPTLAILGLVQPNGPGFPVAEIQCRFTARVMSGNLNLPSKTDMLKDIEQKTELNRKIFYDTPRHTIEIDFIGYQDELAADMGCKPVLWKYALTDPKLFWAMFWGPSLPYQYRLEGPHSWEGARDAILTYEKRVRAPFDVPGKKRDMDTRTLSVPKLLFILPLVLWFFYFFCF